MFFQAIGIALIALFVIYGMDVRHKKGSSSFVATRWLTLMKLLSFSLIACFAAVLVSLQDVGFGDWLCLVLMASGTAFIVAAKRTLHTAHTFTGQYLNTPQLVTRGVYSLTRNPLYLGVFQCEIAAAIIVFRHAEALWPTASVPMLWILTFALLYVVAFNLKMARLESRYLNKFFGQAYTAYSACTPFLFPSFSRSTK